MSEELYKIVVTQLPPTKMVMFRVLQEIGVSRYDEAELIFDHIQKSLPCDLLDGVPSSQANEFKKIFESACGECEIEETDQLLPVLLWPAVGKSYEKKMLGAIRLKK